MMMKIIMLNEKPDNGDVIKKKSFLQKTHSSAGVSSKAKFSPGVIILIIILTLIIILSQ